MEQIQHLIESELTGKLLILGLLICLVLLMSFLLRRGTKRYITDNDSKYRFGKLVSFLAYFLICVSIATIFSDQMKGFTVVLGVMGAGIAFSLQEVIASFAGYVAIFTSSFYKVGDRVQLGGIKGDVIDIGFLRTTLMETGGWVSGDLYNGRIVRVANSFIFKEPVFNYSGDFPFIWDELLVPIKTGSDYELAIAHIQAILDEEVGIYASQAQEQWNLITGKYRLEDARVQPMVSLSWDENWITLTVRYAVDFQKRRTTKHQISERILKSIRSSDGAIEVASAAFEITAFPAKQS